MADNIQVTPGSGATIAADEILIDGGTALVQRVKPVHGAAGSGVDTSRANPFPVGVGLDEYETVAASVTAQVMGTTGATGDTIAQILVTPTTTSPGAVTILDNAISIPVFTGGAASLSNLVPFVIPLYLKSVSGAWKVTTGAGLTCVVSGDFT